MPLALNKADEIAWLSFFKRNVLNKLTLPGNKQWFWKEQKKSDRAGEWRREQFFFWTAVNHGNGLNRNPWNRQCARLYVCKERKGVDEWLRGLEGLQQQLRVTLRSRWNLCSPDSQQNLGDMRRSTWQQQQCCGHTAVRLSGLGSLWRGRRPEAALTSRYQSNRQRAAIGEGRWLNSPSPPPPQPPPLQPPPQPLPLLRSPRLSLPDAQLLKRAGQAEP